ncbi:hypothetical protein T484DRAFT_1850974 [Baffinella frigidus]|nr:hypothetical protein T484DRAFT_1850974 [Cryptophyta sp. CCMP2293]
MLTVFQLMLGDSWSDVTSDVMYSAMQSDPNLGSDVMYSAMQSSPNLGWQVFSALFILSWYIFSMKIECDIAPLAKRPISTIVNNLFVAVIIENFETIVNNLFVAVIIENFEVSQTIESIGRPGRFSQVSQLCPT